jgi:hypothetical protein
VKTRWLFFGFAFCSFFFSLGHLSRGARAQIESRLTPKFLLRKSGLELERRTQAGSFFDVVGHKSAVFGYEHRQLEAWVYPLKLLDDFELSFRVEGYPLAFRASEMAVQVNVRPEATVFTYTEGTDVYLVPQSLAPGAQSGGLRVLRSRADRDALRLLLEGLGGRSYAVRVRTPYQIGPADGVSVQADDNADPLLNVAFEGPSDSYVRRELVIPLRRAAAGRSKRKGISMIRQDVIRLRRRHHYDKDTAPHEALSLFAGRLVAGASPDCFDRTCG